MTSHSHGHSYCTSHHTIPHRSPHQQRWCCFISATPSLSLSQPLAHCSHNHYAPARAVVSTLGIRQRSTVCQEGPTSTATSTSPTHLVDNGSTDHAQGVHTPHTGTLGPASSPPHMGAMQHTSLHAPNTLRQQRRCGQAPSPPPYTIHSFYIIVCRRPPTLPSMYRITSHPVQSELMHFWSLHKLSSSRGGEGGTMATPQGVRLAALELPAAAFVQPHRLLQQPPHGARIQGAATVAGARCPQGPA